MTELREYLKEVQGRVEARLRETLRLAGDCPATLMEAMRYSLLAPGKRLRPLLVVLAAEATGGAGDPLPAACAVEMVHTYSLIHDDLPAMDDDDLRRGLPTCHKQFDEATAILAGDALLTLAFQVLAECYPPRTAAGCTLELARGAGAAGMVGGQVLDLAWDKAPFPSRERGWGEGDIATASPHTPKPNPPRGEGKSSAALPDLEDIHARKTGALFRACLRLGQWVVQGELATGIDPAARDALDGYGRCFGQLFQVTDDLLDVEGDAEQTGKRVQKDAVRGKLTYPALLGIPESRRRAAQLADDSQRALKPLGAAGQRLTELVQLVLHRDR
ncbi:MAG: polyprenyl synthetase family protein [Planctomycetia bacterium]|nr:polyprenyl synthetase family protein [Planctomycetia bacterium]